MSHDTLYKCTQHCLRKPSLSFSASDCRPVCDAGCVHGDCVAPGECHCHFSFVGRRCDTACRCNMHSDCPGVHALDACVECKNNTAGAACGDCEAGFVGDPRDGGSCESCLDYCGGMTEHCFGRRRLLDEGFAKPGDFEGGGDVRISIRDAKWLKESSDGAIPVESCFRLLGRFWQFLKESIPFSKETIFKAFLAFVG